MRYELKDMVTVADLESALNPKKAKPKPKEKPKVEPSTRHQNAKPDAPDLDRQLRLVKRCLKDFVPKKQKGNDMVEWIVRNELATYIEQYIPRDEVKMEQRCRSGNIDIEVSRHIAIELKIVRQKTQLWNLLGQLKKYSDEYPNVYLWFWDLNGIIDQIQLRDFQRNCATQSPNVEVIKRPQ